MKPHFLRYTFLGAFAAFPLATGVFAQNITEEILANPSPSDWVNYGFNRENHRHSPLTQVTKDNVRNLQLVWARGMEPGANQGNALVYQGVMYLPNPNDVFQAIDAKTGDLIWEHRRAVADRSSLLHIGERARGIAIYGDKLYYASHDNFIVALNLKDGTIAWETDRGNNTEVSNSSGPIVANGVVIAGSSCQYAAYGCYVTGHDAASGEELWRNTFIPKPGEEGDETWGNDFEARWMTAAWGQITYDPVTDLVHYGSSGAGPASEFQRGTVGGSMAGTNTRFAVRPKTGEIVWKHQVLPRDNWDQDCTFEMMVATTDVAPTAEMEGALGINPAAAGEGRRVLTGVPCKNGTIWQFDAATGEFLWARDTSLQNLIADVEDATGNVIINEEVVFTEERTTVNMCPGFMGGRDWPTSALNTDTGIFFVPTTNMCTDLSAVDEEFTPLDSYNTTGTARIADGKDKLGRIDAVDISTGKTLWTYEQPTVIYAPLTSTATGLLFFGGTDRSFKALDQETGEVLWQTRLATVASGHPISYEVDGKQYIAINGGGTMFGTSMNRILPDLRPDAVLTGGAVYVFALSE